ncbi:MAG: MarR family transcriptional regulator, partial [Ignavibacteria bacterium]|nr:MarR family transcriptional regulator [Ignavibacteria bacterium]
NASRLVDKLKAKGLVDRRECPNDRRAVDILITDKGLILLKELDKEILHFDEKLQKLEPDEMRAVNEILDKLRQNDTDIEKSEDVIKVSNKEVTGAV